MIKPSLVAVFSLLVSFGFSQSADSAVSHTVFLVGDGGEPYVKDNPIAKVLTERISGAPGKSTVLFLGDNVYPAGLPTHDAKISRKHELALLSLRTQVGFIQDPDARAIFIPGNHDWAHWGKNGLEFIRNQQAWIDSLKDDRITMLPQNGCPGPIQVPLDDNTLLLILDTQWFLHQYDKPRDADLCNGTTTAEVLTLVEDIFRNNRDKRIIVAAHHPLITYGEHGGIFTWRAHIFPLTEVSEHLYIPLPVIGSIYPFYRRWLGHLQDTAHPLYEEFADALMNIMRRYPGSMYVAGHEHALQYIVRDNTYFVVSGSASKTEYVKEKGDAVYAKDVRGFAQLSLLADGRLVVDFHQVDDLHPAGIQVFSETIEPIEVKTTSIPAGLTYSGEYVNVSASDQYDAGKMKRRLLGENYRSAWSQQLKVPVFDIGTEKGGMKILQRGGGQQTLSLRLRDSIGHEYVLRSVEKFPEGAIPEALRETFAQDLVQDQISAAHPYAALVVAPMAEALGLYHTNPKLVYIPDDPRFGEYRDTFANTLALFEERPDEDWSEAPYFGNSKNIVSTRKVIEKLAEDNDNRVDQEFVLRNRLFDLIIGDWDRHDDQWRWATVGEKKNKVYRPIPRDRDQTFFVNEGTLAKVWSRRWALPKFEGFDEDIDWPSGLSFNARHFDRTFLTELSREDWIKTAEDLKRDLTDEVIESSIRQWPKELFALHGETIIRKLKARRDKIVSYAIDHYQFLSREVEITGSDKTEAFDVERVDNGDLHVIVYKISKKGNREKMYDRVFHADETREIRLYGLNGNDMFNVSGSSRNRSIKLRVIGGDGNDVLSDSAEVSGRKTWFYDQDGQGEIKSSGEVRDRRSSRPSVNEYNRVAFEYDRLAPLVWGQYNPDDRIFLGAGFLFIKHGFRKDPFAQRHLFLASVAPETGSYDFQYQGKFTRVAGPWDVEIDADVKAPNYVNNFFGMGNESVFNDEIDDVPGIGVDEAIQYYRYRFNEISFYPSMSRTFGSWGTLQLGPTYQRVKMEDPGIENDRYIEEYAIGNDEDLFAEAQSFAGLRWAFTAGQRDNELYPQRGSFFKISGRNLAALNSGGNSFSDYQGSLAFFYSVRPRSRLVLAARAGAGINTGEYPFYQAQILDGKQELRGFRKTRFYGDSKVYGNFEARLRLASFRSYLFPATFGVLGFYDVGRIWYKNDDGMDPSASEGTSSRWHQGFGGGVWFTPFNLTVLSLEAGHSREGTLGYVRLGFLF